MYRLSIWGVALAMTLVASGCGEESSSTSGDMTESSSNSTTTVYAGGDVTVNQTTVTDNGVYIENADGTITYVEGTGNTVNETNDGSGGFDTDNRTGDYDAEWSEDTCRENGYFFCPISQKCLDQPAEGGSCTL